MTVATTMNQFPAVTPIEEALPWHDMIAQHLEFWFGRSFWVSVVAFTFIMPGFQLLWLCNVDFPLVADFVALLDVVAAGFLFSLGWGLTSFATYTLISPSRFYNLLKRVFPDEFRALKAAGWRYGGTMNESQKRDEIQGLVDGPYGFKIFKRYVFRVAFIISTIPLYVAMAMFALGAVPRTHLGRTDEGFRKIVSALEVIRDVQTEMFGGSSNEHGLRVNDDNADANAALAKDAGQRVHNQKSTPDHPALREGISMGGHLTWEIVGVLSAVMYVIIVLIFFPLQIGIVENLNEHLKSPVFWDKHLTEWYRR